MQTGNPRVDHTEYRRGFRHNPFYPELLALRYEHGAAWQGAAERSPISFREVALPQMPVADAGRDLAKHHPELVGPARAAEKASSDFAAWLRAEKWADEDLASAPTETTVSKDRLLNPWRYQ